MKTALRPEDLKGKLVLDVGCGMGRFAEVATAWARGWSHRSERGGEVQRRTWRIASSWPSSGCIRASVRSG